MQYYMYMKGFTIDHINCWYLTFFFFIFYSNTLVCLRLQPVFLH